MSKPLLQVRDLCIDFVLEDRTIEAVKGATFDLAAGETLAIVGESGSGKSVTALALTRLLPVPPAVIKRGEIEFEGRNVLTMDAPQLRKLRGGRIAYIFQEPSTSLNPVYTVRSQIAEAVRLHRPDVTDVDAEVVRCLDMVGIVSPRQRMDDYPHQLSGGMQRRVGIVRALATDPVVAFFDEPTAGLDPVTSTIILNMIRDLAGKTADQALVVATSNVEIAIRFADRVVVVHEGRVVADGPWRELLVDGPEWVQRFLSVRLIGLDEEYARELDLPDRFIDRYWHDGSPAL